MNYTKEEIDLVISNGAFSEMDRELQQIYLKNVIANAKNGYFITNFNTHSEPLGGFSLNEFVDTLRSFNKNVYVLSPTHRWLSGYDESNSKLIVFGQRLNVSLPPGSYFDLFRYQIGKRLIYFEKKFHGAIDRLIFT